MIGGRPPRSLEEAFEGGFEEVWDDERQVIVMRGKVETLEGYAGPGAYGFALRKALPHDTKFCFVVCQPTGDAGLADATVAIDGEEYRVRAPISADFLLPPKLVACSLIPPNPHESFKMSERVGPREVRITLGNPDTMRVINYRVDVVRGRGDDLIIVLGPKALPTIRLHHHNYNGDRIGCTLLTVLTLPWFITASCMRVYGGWYYRKYVEGDRLALTVNDLISFYLLGSSGAGDWWVGFDVLLPPASSVAAGFAVSREYDGYTVPWLAIVYKNFFGLRVTRSHAPTRILAPVYLDLARDNLHTVDNYAIVLGEQALIRSYSLAGGGKSFEAIVAPLGPDEVAADDVMTSVTGATSIPSSTAVTSCSRVYARVSVPAGVPVRVRMPGRLNLVKIPVGVDNDVVVVGELWL